MAESSLGTTEPTPGPWGLPKHPRYADVKQRQKSFELPSWPHGTLLNSWDIARAGFFYTGKRDRTTCFHCDVSLGKWAPGDDPYEEHSMWSSRCGYIILLRHGGGPNDGIPTEKKAEGDSGFQSMGVNVDPSGCQEKGASGYAVSVRSPFKVPCAIAEEATSSGSEDFPQDGIREEYAVVRTEPAHPSYALLRTREDSFAHFPGPRGNTRNMARAGFFYTGTKDCTTCFQCGNSVENWTRDDDPFVEHARWFPDCPHLALNVGRGFIRDVGRKERDFLARRRARLCNDDDPVLEMIVRELWSAPSVSRLLAEGFESSYVEMAIRNRLNVAGVIDVFDDGEMRRALLDVLSLPRSLVTPKAPKSPRSLLRNCILCEDKEKNVVLLPCYHLVMCQSCAGDSSKCPQCHVTIRNRKTVYLS